jgi:hypothetical protein
VGEPDPVDWKGSRHRSVGGTKYGLLLEKAKAKEKKRKKGNGEKRSTNHRSKDKLLPAINAS